MANYLNKKPVAVKNNLIRNLLITFALFTLVFQSNISLANERPEEMLSRITDTMISSLRQNDARLKQNPEYVVTIINRILVPHVDSRSMARWVAGRQAWANADNSQRQNFTSEFRDLLIRTYASTLLEYNDQSVQYFPPRQDTSKSRRVQVSSVIKESGKEPIRVSYRLVNKQGSWKVYDISIEGVSLLKGFRSQFATDFKQKGIDSVTQRIRRHNDQPFKK